MTWARLRISPEIFLDTLPSSWASTRENSSTKFGAVGKAKGLLIFSQCYNFRHVLDLFVFSNRALINDQAGAGYSIRRGQNSEIEQGKVSLGQQAEIYNTDFVGGTGGLAATILNPPLHFVTPSIKDIDTLIT